MGKQFFEKKWMAFPLLILLAWVVHFLVLSFIFPGYYRPLSFHHSDFYIPAAFAYAPDGYFSFSTLMNWPRPLFMWFYKFTGYFGHEGSVAWVIGIVFFNTALTALLVKRWLNIPLDKRFIVLYFLYAFLLFSAPFFYTFYSQDIGSQLSYLLFLLAAWSFTLLRQLNIVLAGGLVFIFSLAALLVKETYAISAAFVAFMWFVANLKAGYVRASTPLVALSAAVIAVAINIVRTKSVFVNPDAAQGSSYSMNLELISVAIELFRYIKDGLTPLVIFLILVMILGLYKVTRNYKLSAVVFCGFVFALLSWLPNALLPNHYYPGYSFNGLYVCLATVFVVLKLPTLSLSWRSPLLVMILLVLLTPLTSLKKYNGSRNAWVLAMEEVQTNMLAGFRVASAGLIGEVDPVSILIEGISSPFHPFAFPFSLYSFEGGGNGLYYFPVPESSNRINTSEGLVNFIGAKDVSIMSYDQVWFFDDKGYLVRIERN